MTDEQKPIVFDNHVGRLRLQVVFDADGAHPRNATPADLAAAGYFRAGEVSSRLEALTERVLAAVSPVSELAELRTQLEDARAWPAPPPGESLHKATLELWECAKSHESGSRLLGNVTAFSIQALCEYSMNYAFKNATAQRAEAERDAALLKQRSAELGLEEFQRSAAVVEERNAQLASELAQLKAERTHLLEAAELLRENPNEERWRWLRIQWLDRDNGRFPKTGSDQAKAADWATEEVTSGEPGSFGCDPEDSAALLRLREAIDAADLWPSEMAKEQGDYEFAVRYMASRTRAADAMEDRLNEARVRDQSKAAEPERCLHTSGITSTQCVKEAGHAGPHRVPAPAITIEAEPEATVVAEPKRWTPWPKDRVRHKQSGLTAVVRTAPPWAGDMVSVVYDGEIAAVLCPLHLLEPEEKPPAPVVEAQDPMARPVTFGDMIEAVGQAQQATSGPAFAAMLKLREKLERIAKGGGK